MSDETKTETTPIETQTVTEQKPKAKSPKAKKEPAKKEAPEVKARYAPKGTISDPTKQRITVLAKSNPKRPGTKCYTWFSWYKSGMTVAQYFEKGGRADHIRWDVQHGFISLKS